MPFRTYAERGRAVTHVHDDMIVGDDAVPGRGGRGRPALDPRRPGRARRGRPAHHGGQAPTRGATHHAGLMADSPIRARPVGLHHAGRGPALRRQPGRPRPDRCEDARGFPVARVTYRPGRHELVAYGHYGPRLAAILKEMGAEWTAVTTSPGQRQRLVARGGAREPAQHGNGADGDGPGHLGGRPVRAAATRPTTWWWPTPRCSSPRPATDRPSPWPPWPPGPPTSWSEGRPTAPRPPADRPADRPLSRRPG